MAVITIEFTNGKKYISRPVTVGLEKRLARFSRDTGNDAMRAAELQEKAQELQQAADTPEARQLASAAMRDYNEIMERLEGALDTRDQIIVQAFGDQFTLDDLENYCPKEEAGRVISELQGVAKGVVEKNG